MLNERQLNLSPSPDLNSVSILTGYENRVEANPQADLIRHMHDNHHSNRNLPDSFVHVKKFSNRAVAYNMAQDSSDDDGEHIVSSAEDAIMSEQMEGLLDETPGHHFNQQHKAKIEKVSSQKLDTNIQTESQYSALELFNKDLQLLGSNLSYLTTIFNS